LSSQHGFSQLGLHKNLMQALTEKGYSVPTPIQAEAIPPALAGKDVIGQAQTGTGKTAVFALAILQKITPELPVVQALVLTPTRELAVQVSDEVRALAKYSHATTALLYGGQDINPQIRQLRHGAQVVVGTPGRILDHLERKSLDARNVTIMVLDEADRMLDMGFIDDVERIMSYISKTHARQTLLFSATMPDEIRRLAHKHMSSPVFIKTSEDSMTVDKIAQFYVSVENKLKPKALAALIAKEKPASAIVFCRTKHGTDSLARLMKGYGFDALAMHGNLTQSRRESVLSGFKSGRTQLMIATDVAGRGLDFTGVTHVFNYDPPNDAFAYVHRIGRTGRAGASGKAISLVTNLMEIRDLRSVANRVGSEILKMELNMNDAPTFNHTNVEPREESHGRFGGGGRGRGGPRGGSGSGGGRFGGRGQSSGGYGQGGSRPRGQGSYRPSREHGQGYQGDSSRSGHSGGQHSRPRHHDPNKYNESR